MTAVQTAALSLVLSCIGAFGCSSTVTQHGAWSNAPADTVSGSELERNPDYIREVVPPLSSFAITDRGWQRGAEPFDGERAPVAARIFAFADSQLHYQLGKRTFAQSPFAERMSFEVAVRPAALDDSSDLLLAEFLRAYRAHYRDHALVFLGDAADLSCVQEMEAFASLLQSAGIRSLYPVTSNHDGFFAGNFTSRRDVDGNLRLTDMPRDWTRACAPPGSRADRRLTKGRAVARLRDFLADGDGWMEAAWDRQGPTEYRATYLYYVRQLGGGERGAPPVFGVFLDTVDYRGFDFEGSRGAGSAGAVSRAQLRFLERAMFEAANPAQAAGRPVTFLVFGHHPFHQLERRSRRRIKEFLRRHRNVAAYISAHTHASMERRIELAPPKQRTDRAGLEIPSLIVGSTTDAPQAARTIEIRVDPVSGRRSLKTRRLQLDGESMCAEVAPMAADTTGYTGYRILRDGTPALSISWLEKLLFVTGLDDLGKKRALQAIGALLMENELMRAWARLYRDAPIPLTTEQRAGLDDILAHRYAGGQTASELRPYLQGRAPRRASRRWRDAGYDPVIAPVLTSAERGVHRFANHRRLIRALRTLRTHSPEARRYFICHAIHAARAEAKRSRTDNNVLYIR